MKLYDWLKDAKLLESFGLGRIQENEINDFAGNLNFFSVA
jgi:hypothetical protein